MLPRQRGTGCILAGHGLVSVLPCTGAEPSCCSSKSLFFPYILIPFQVTVFPVEFPQFTVYPSLNKLVSACCFIFHTLHIPSQYAFSQHLLTSQLLSQEPKPGLCSWAISKPALGSCADASWGGRSQTGSPEWLRLRAHLSQLLWSAEDRDVFLTWT